MKKSTKSPEAKQALLALSTTGSLEEAKRLARALVEQRLAACVNIVPRVHSIYRWQDEVTSDDECLLIIKTTDSAFDRLARTLRKLHSYDVPELIRLEIEGGDSEYLDWLRAQTAGHYGP